MADSVRFIRWFREISLDDVPLVGGKNASLGEMYRELVPLGANVPNGFAITAEAYRAILDSNGVSTRLDKILEDMDINNVRDLADRAYQARELVYGAGIPGNIQEQILTGYHELQNEYGTEVSLLFLGLVT